MTDLNSLNKELKTLVGYQALAELRSRFAESGEKGREAGESFLHREIEERITKLMKRREQILRNIERLLGLEHKLVKVSDDLLAIINGLDSGTVAVKDVGGPLASVAGYLEEIASRNDGLELHGETDLTVPGREELSQLADLLQGKAEQQQPDRKVLTRQLDEILNSILRLVESVSSSVSMLEAMDSKCQVKASNYQALSVDTDTMAEAARELWRSSMNSREAGLKKRRVS